MRNKNKQISEINRGFLFPDRYPLSSVHSLPRRSLLSSVAFRRRRIAKAGPLSSGFRLLVSDTGFTLIELVMVIVILGLLGVAVAIKWPQGMEQEAAVLEFTRAVRFAQHVSLTRGFEGSARAWGISTQGNRYTIRRADSSETVAVPGISDDPVGSRTYPLLKNVPVTAASVYFNGYGEPINTTTGAPLTTAVTFRIGSDSIPISVCQETGYVLRGATCP